MEKVFAVVHVTGYTSESEIQVFKNEQDAQFVFDQWLKDHFGVWLHITFNLTIEQFHNLPPVEKEEMDITFDNKYDVTWDSFEVYERLYIEPLIVNI
jgi:hypothetical protein